MTPEENILQKVTSREFFSSISNQYQLTRHLVNRDFILQYKRSFLGILWSLLLPLGQLLVLIFVFQVIIPLNIDAYPVFLFCALLPWSWFSNCISSAGGLFIGNRDLVRRPNFDPSVLVFVNTLSNLLLYLVAFPLLFILMLVYERPITLSLFMLPLLIIIQGMLIFGLSLIIATVNAFYSDVQHIVSIALMMLFFLTPVFYSYQSIDETYRVLYFLNPMATLIQNYRLILFDGISPGLSFMIFASLSSMIACIVGYVVYSRQIHNMIDII